MTERSLQVTYRKGRPFAAYLHLSHATGENMRAPWPQLTGSWSSTTTAMGDQSAWR